MRTVKAVLLCLLTAFYAGCGWFAGDSPEAGLLAVFSEELDRLKEGESSSYADYMAGREAGYKDRQKRVNALIDVINRRFEAMPEAEKMAYQSKWRAEFQPVVGEIYTRTRELVVRETRDLTPREMARIKELSVRLKALEKETPQATLKPLFFILPEEEEPS